MSQAFGSALARLRQARNLSQREAAADLHISQALLSHYENGLREPKLDFVVKVCDYYNVSADYILGRSAFCADDALRELAEGVRALNALADRLTSQKDPRGDL